MDPIVAKMISISSLPSAPAPVRHPRSARTECQVERTHRQPCGRSNPRRILLWAIRAPVSILISPRSTTRQEGRCRRDAERLSWGGHTSRERGRRGRTESELADDAADVGTGLDEALEVGRERVAAVEAVLEHGGHGLTSDELRSYRETSGDVR